VRTPNLSDSRGYQEKTGRERERIMGRVAIRGLGDGESQGRGWERGRRGHKRRGSDPCLAHLQPSDVAVLISPALIASINNTAL
jgi:hypothetical protein